MWERGLAGGSGNSEEMPEPLGREGRLQERKSEWRERTYIERVEKNTSRGKAVQRNLGCLHNLTMALP